MGREVYTKNILSNVRRIWTDELGKKEKDLKDIKIYIKPEENKAYYVINGDITGSVWIWHIKDKNNFQILWQSHKSVTWEWSE